jgi:hypothetical protein
MVRFDAYTATVRDADYRDLCQIVDFSGAKVTGSKGHYGYSERISFRDACGAELACVQFGGTNAATPMVEFKGDRTPLLVDAVRSAFPEHSCSRVDSAYDLDRPGAWDALLTDVLAVKADHKLKGEKRGDWDDHPEDGRTMYLGAPTSPVRCRLYEKGRQPDYRALGMPNWVRLEVQVRPAKAAKKRYATLDAEQVWGASRYTRDLAARVLQREVDPFPAGTVHKESPTQQKRRSMMRQYGAIALDWLTEAGSIEELRRQYEEIMRTNRLHK